MAWYHALMIPALWARVNRHGRRLDQLENHMAELKDVVKSAQDAESRLEKRVTAHEQHAEQVKNDLQAEIDKLVAGQTSTADAASNLQALVDRMDNFDADAPNANNADGTPAAQGQLPSDQGGTAPVSP